MVISVKHSHCLTNSSDAEINYWNCSQLSPLLTHLHAAKPFKTADSSITSSVMEGFVCEHRKQYQPNNSSKHKFKQFKMSNFQLQNITDNTLEQNEHLKPKTERQMLAVS